MTDLMDTFMYFGVGGIISAVISGISLIYKKAAHRIDECENEIVELNTEVQVQKTQLLAIKDDLEEIKSDVKSLLFKQ